MDERVKTVLRDLGIVYLVIGLGYSGLHSCVTKIDHSTGESSAAYPLRSSILAIVVWPILLVASTQAERGSEGTANDSGAGLLQPLSEAQKGRPFMLGLNTDGIRGSADECLDLAKIGQMPPDNLGLRHETEVLTIVERPAGVELYFSTAGDCERVRDQLVSRLPGEDGWNNTLSYLREKFDLEIDGSRVTPPQAQVDLMHAMVKRRLNADELGTVTETMTSRMDSMNPNALQRAALAAGALTEMTLQIRHNREQWELALQSWRSQKVRLKDTPYAGVVAELVARNTMPKDYAEYEAELFQVCAKRETTWRSPEGEGVTLSAKSIAERRDAGVDAMNNIEGFRNLLKDWVRRERD